jgi:hypothetical protein
MSTKVSDGLSVWRISSVHEEYPLYMKTILCARRISSVHEEYPLYTKTILCVWRISSVHEEYPLYMKNILCTCRISSVHVEYPLFTSCTSQRACGVRQESGWCTARNKQIPQLNQGVAAFLRYAQRSAQPWLRPLQECLQELRSQEWGRLQVPRRSRKQERI